MSVSNLNSASSTSSTPSVDQIDSTKKNNLLNSVSKKGNLIESSNDDFSQMLMNDLNLKTNNETLQAQKNFLDQMLSGADGEINPGGIDASGFSSGDLRANSKTAADKNILHQHLKKIMNLQSTKNGDLDINLFSPKSEAKIDPEQLKNILAKMNSFENTESSKLVSNQGQMQDLAGKNLKNQNILSMNQSLKNSSLISPEDISLQNGQLGELDKKQILKILKNYEKNKSNENIFQSPSSQITSKKNLMLDEKNVKSSNEQNSLFNNQNQILNNKNIEISKNGFESQFSTKDNPHSSLLEQLTTRITDSLKLMSAPPMQQSMSFSVNHAELGAMRVDIRRLGGDRFSLNMSPDELQTHKLLMDNKDSILQALSQRGISIVDLTIDQNQLSKNAKDSLSESNLKSQDQQFFDQNNQSNDNFARNFERQSGRDKRQELWNYMKQQREVRYA